MTYPSKAIGLLLLASITASASAGIRRHDRTDAQYQAHANQSQFDATARLQILGPSGAITGSGTLLNSEWILTAAHLFDGVTNPNATILLGGAFGFASEVIINPNWTPGQLTQGGDLALIRLSTPITTVTPAMLYQGSNELGAMGTGVGFGRSGTGFSGDVAGTMGIKRAGTNIIDVLGSDRGFHESILLTDFDNPVFPSDSTYGSAIPTDLEYQVAPGDSGGSLFIQENNQWYLAGTTSFINATDGNPDADYGDMSAYTRLSDYNAWINSIIPAPSALMILSAGLFTTTRRRRLS